MPRVLLVDDDARVLATIKRMLEINQYEVIAVSDARASLGAFERNPCDAAIVDIFMLEMDGMTVIKALRERAPRLPVVVISGGPEGAAALDFLREATNFTAIVCLQKPFRPPALIAALQQAVLQARTASAQ